MPCYGFFLYHRWRAARSSTHPSPCQALPINPSAPQVVYEWARGTPFKDICGLTDVMEGTIVRAMVRLDETCR